MTDVSPFKKAAKQRVQKRARTLATPDEVTQMPHIFDDMVAVLVGNRTINCHKSVITRSSIFFMTETMPGARTDDSEPIDLSSENPTVFEGYMCWLYSRKIDAKAVRNDSHGHLACLYVLGEKLTDEVFQKAVLDTLIENALELKKYPSLTTIKTIYEGTDAGSPARRLMVDFWACKANIKWDGVKKLSEATSVDFVDDLIPALLRYREKSSARPWFTQPELYHDNDTDDAAGTAQEPASDTDEDTSPAILRLPSQQTGSTKTSASSGLAGNELVVRKPGGFSLDHLVAHECGFQPRSYSDDDEWYISITGKRKRT